MHWCRSDVYNLEVFSNDFWVAEFDEYAFRDDGAMKIMWRHFVDGIIVEGREESTLLAYDLDEQQLWYPAGYREVYAR